MNQNAKLKAELEAKGESYAGDMGHYMIILAMQCYNKRVKQFTGEDIPIWWKLDSRASAEDIFLYNTFIARLDMPALNKEQLVSMAIADDYEQQCADSVEALSYAHYRITKILDIDVLVDWDPDSTPNDMTKVGSAMAIDLLADNPFRQ